MKKVSLVLLSLSTIMYFVSCGSKPAADQSAPEAPETAVETTVEDSTDSIAQLMEKVNDARKSAIEAGADKNCPEQMKKLDNLLAGLKDSKDPNGSAKSIIEKYNLLANYSKAKESKKEIDDNGFASLAPNNYDSGIKNLEKVEKVLSSNPDEFPKTAFVDAENAYKDFNAVLNVAYKKIAKTEREAAMQAKKMADSVKAGVARKAEYKEAAELIQNGDTLYSMQNSKKATEKYKSANSKFTYLYQDVSEKRAAAQAAIDEAKKRVAESAEFAEQADVKAPITEKVEGIEDEDAVLLEADNYEAPEKAEANIAEDIKDEYEVEAK
ncbi:MAG: hypothetical protein J6X84_00345 [Treponema sp.]|nr:hypothetical protein [Treponema sp.]